MSKRMTCAISLGKSKKGKRTKFGSKSIRNENIKNWFQMYQKRKY